MMNRRAFKSALLSIVFALSGLAATSAAEDSAKYPSQPLRFVVPFSPGGTTDYVARVIQAKLQETLGQSVVVENRPGAAGNVAMEIVAKTAPDGYTIMLGDVGTMTINAALYPDLKVKPLVDFQPISVITHTPSLLVVGPTFPPKSVKELVEFANARPGKVFNATGVVGGADHLTAERFKHFAGIKAKHVSFKGSVEALIEAAAGRAHFSSTGLAAAMPLIQDGKLIPLVQLVPMLRNVPVAADVVPGWKPMGAQSIVVRSGVPMAIRQKLSKEVGRILAMADVRERLTSVSFQITPSTPEEHDKKLLADIAAFAAIVKEIGLQ